MIKAAETVFLCMAWEQTVREVVEKYQREILSRHKWTNIREVDQCKEYGHEIDLKVITDPKASYLLTDADFDIYLKECEEQRKIAGLSIRAEGNCPLLEAESNTRDARRLLIESMEHITGGMTVDDILCSRNGLENYHKMVDLSLRMIAPFCSVKNTLSFIKS